MLRVSADFQLSVPELFLSFYFSFRVASPTELPPFLHSPSFYFSFRVAIPTELRPFLHSPSFYFSFRVASPTELRPFFIRPASTSVSVWRALPNFVLSSFALRFILRTQAICLTYCTVIVTFCCARTLISLVLIYSVCHLLVMHTRRHRAKVLAKANLSPAHSDSSSVPTSVIIFHCPLLILILCLVIHLP